MVQQWNSLQPRYGYKKVESLWIYATEQLLSKIPKLPYAEMKKVIVLIFCFLMKESNYEKQTQKVVVLSKGCIDKELQKTNRKIEALKSAS